MRDLEGKLALVTGGGKGVGRVIARQLADRGAHVIVNFFHSLDAAKQVKAELEASGARVDVIRASVAQPHQVDRMFEEIEQKHGHLDILVNNAASGAFVPVAGVTEEFFARALDTNLKGSFWCARRAAPLMARRGGGCIVNVSSIGSDQVVANYLVVGTSKAAVESLTRYLAVEFAPLNIRVNTASATMLEGDVAHLFPRFEEMKAVHVEATPMKRLGTAEDLAGVVHFLTSEHSRWVTGQTILADGGLSLNSVSMAPPPLVLSEPTPAKPAPTQAAAAGPTPISDASKETLADARPAGRPHPSPLPEGEGTLSRPPPATRTAWTHSAAVANADGDPDDESIAIVGMGLVVPGATNVEEYWRVLMEGPDLCRPVPPDRWDASSFHSSDQSCEDKTYQDRSIFIADAAEPAEPTTRWLRDALAQALAGVTRRGGDRHSFVVGYTADGSQHLEESLVLSGMLHRLSGLLEASADGPDGREALYDEISATLRRHYWRGVEGPSRFLPHNVGRNAMDGLLPAESELLMVDTACSSSLYAVDIGMKGLLMGKHDVAVCGGSFALGPRGSVLFAKLHGLSVRGEPRPLDRTADGVLFSDGAGVVVLKRLRRALADGDRVLAVIKGFGSSSDGKGKAIYAPSAEGQAIAVRRALAHPAVDAERIDWVVAHATGTPAGDTAEFSTLRQLFKADRPVYVTSNKAVIGHTGWAAGVVSLIEVVLGLQKQVIPPQHRFTAPPDDFEIEQSNLRIPTAPVAWPPNVSRPRAASISSFGFGGTNAHLVVEEYRPDAGPAARLPERAYDERIAIVGWAAHLPGLESPAEVEAWLSGAGSAPSPSFGDTYPLPPFEKVRMPPAALRALDRCQLMVLECAHRLRAQLGDFWEANRDTTGVFVGHMGATRSATLYGSRCYLDDVESALLANGRLGGAAALGRSLERLRAEVGRLVPPSNENSFPGSMPNVIPARVCNAFDLHGLNMAVDTGFSATLAAVEIAARYLRSRDLDVALVGGINGNSTPDLAPLLRDLTGRADVVVGEGAFLFALVRESTAAAAGLPVLAVIDDASAVPGESEVVECGAAPSGRATYLGAEAAVAIAQTLARRARGTTAVVCRSADGVVRLGLVAPSSAAAVERSGRPHHTRCARALPEGEGTRADDVAPEREGRHPVAVPASFLAEREYAPGHPLEVRRQVVVLDALPLEPVRPPIGLFPAGTLVLTDQPELLELIGDLPDDLTILSVADRPGRRGIHVPAVTPEAVETALAGRGPFRHLRVFSDLSAAAPPAECLWREPTGLVALHDLTFLALKHCHDALRDGDGSFVSLFMGALPDGAPHPFTGLFGGLTKSVALELPACFSAAVFSDATDVREGAAQAAAETTARQLLPVVFYRSGERRTLFLEETPGELPGDAPARLDASSVVLATAGARGITAELLKAVAQHFRPRLYLIGSNRLDSYPPELFADSDEEFAKRRPTYLREARAARPERTLGELNREFDRMADARAARQNIEAMARYCGVENVHYVACDVLDRERLAAVVSDILRAEGKIDLVVNAAGLNRAASIPVKSVENFRAVRDIKLRGYQNLKYALRDHAPRLWCNFGSFLGLTGQSGELDYAAANDFLASSALYSSQALGREEFTIGWGLWRSVGLGADPLKKAFLEKTGLYTSMATEEGIHHFVREINLPRHAPSVIHLGAAEQKALTDYAPTFFTARAAVQAEPPPQRRGGFYLGRVLAQSADEVLFERIFDLTTDAYLAHHTVNGYATLPGTFVPEIAAEAALRLLPGMHVVAFEDAVFHHFLRVYDRARPSAKKIHARVIERAEGQATVQVKVLTDVVAPNGAVLTRDKLHFEIKVLLAERVPPAPRWEPWEPAGEVAVPDPYHFEHAPVRLTDVFVSTRDTRSHPLGKRAAYRLAVPPDDPTFSSFLLPSILLDGLARLAVLSLVEGEYIALAAPATIRRIDVYEALNDSDLAARGEPIELYATPGAISFDQDSGRNRFVAVRPDGRIVLQMKDVTGTVIGFVHRATGQFVSRQELVEIGQRRAAPPVAADPPPKATAVAVHDAAGTNTRNWSERAWQWLQARRTAPHPDRVGSS
jgi:3-oxoacyl-(acyl-carrier-protein) synthase/NAD(P)-dependent dehydrogenase (short-subunit alcohol dehydrogenase family)